MGIPIKSKFMQTMDALRIDCKKFLRQIWSEEEFKSQMIIESEKLMVLIRELREDKKKISEEDFFKNMIVSLKEAGLSESECSFHLGVMLNAFQEANLIKELRLT